MSFAVMISHSTKEKPIAEAVCQRLEAAGFPCWIAPRNIPPGAEWTAAILEGIAASRMMVLIFSGSANESKHVAREVLYAGDNHKPVLPFRVQETVPTGGLAYYLLGVQWLDAWPLPLEPHFEALVARVRLLLSEGAAAVGASPGTEAAEYEKTALPLETDITFKCAACGELMLIEAAGAGMRVDCLGCGKPVNVPGGTKQATPAPSPLTPAACDAVADRLGLILGPIARHLVKTASAGVSTLPDLYQKLAEFIPAKNDRETFLKSCQPGLEIAVSPDPSKLPPVIGQQHSPVIWQPETLLAVKNGLAVYLGPMAGLVVDQTARQARTMNELYDLLAAKISSPKDREKWSKSLSRSTD